MLKFVYIIGSCILLKMDQLRPLFCLFLVFSNKQYNFSTNQCEKCPSSIWRWDLNPQPFEHESSPITTRPGLLPRSYILWYCIDILVDSKMCCARYNASFLLNNDFLGQSLTTTTTTIITDVFNRLKLE